MRHNKYTKGIRNLLQGCSGKIGNLVFYQLHGKTFVRKAAGGYNKIATPKQAAVRSTFEAAQLFAKTIINDPVLKAIYQAKAVPPQNAYTMAVSDYMLEHKLPPTSKAATPAAKACAVCIFPTEVALSERNGQRPSASSLPVQAESGVRLNTADQAKSARDRPARLDAILSVKHDNGRCMYEASEERWSDTCWRETGTGRRGDR